MTTRTDTDVSKPSDLSGFPWFAIAATGRIRLYEIHLAEIDEIRRSFGRNADRMTEPPPPWTSCFGSWLRELVFWSGQSGILPCDAVLLDVSHAPGAMMIGIFVGSADFEPIGKPWFAIESRSFPRGPAPRRTEVGS